MKKRRIEQGGSGKATGLYHDILTMKEFNLAPDQWRRLTRIDRKILHAWRIVQEYHLDMQAGKAREKTGGSDFIKKLPRQRI